MTSAPAEFRTELEKMVYEMLERLQIPFERIDNEPAITMEDCEAVDAALDVKTVKTLLVCNRQQTEFYLFVTGGDKPFSTKDFGRALGISRVSFAPVPKLQEMLGTELGATTVFSTMLASPEQIHLVIDEDVANDPWYGCTDGTTTCYMKLRTSDILEKFLPTTGHVPVIIKV